MTAQIAPAKARYGFVALMALVYLFHSVDRQIIAVVMEPIRHAFNASDKMLGLVGGLGHGTMFALASLPVAWLIDRVNRARLLAVLLAVWSALTVLCGFSTSFVLLVLARMGVGAAEAGGSPTIISLISDYFEPRQRPLAIGICYTSTAFGVGVSFLIGSFVAARFGWRAAFWLAGVPGLVLAFVIYLALREPVRGSTDDRTVTVFEHVHRAPTLRETFVHVWGNRAVAQLAVAMALLSLVWSTLWIWCSPLLIRFHGLSLPQAGVTIAAAALFQALGSWLGGIAGDRVAARFGTAGLGILAGTMTLISIPLSIAFAFGPTLPITLGLLSATVFFFGACQGPAFGMCMTVAHPRARGAVASFVQFACNLVGSGLGPFLMGVLSDFWSGNLPRALAVLCCLNIVAALFFILAAGTAKGRGATAPSLNPRAPIAH